MPEILVLLNLRQFQSTQVEIFLVISFLLNDRLTDSFQSCIHVGDPHIRNTVNVDFRIQHHTLKILMADHFRQQPVIEVPGGQYCNRIITQMQSIQLCVWVIFIFCQTQQIVRRNAVELRQGQDRKGADVLSRCIGFVFSQGRTGQASAFRQFFQRQMKIHDTQVFQSFLNCELRLHTPSPFHKRGNPRIFALFSCLLDIRERAYFFAKLYL